MKSRHLAKCLDRQQVGVVKNDLKIFDVKLTILNIFKSKSACVYTRLYANLLTLNISQISRKFSHGKENFSYKVKLSQYSVLGHFKEKSG